MVCVKIVIPSQLHPHIRMLPNYPAILIVLYCSLLFYCPYYTKVITIKIPKYLAGCFLLLPNWGSSPHFQIFAPTSLLLALVLLGNFPLFQKFAPTSLLPALVPLGNFPLFGEFAPTSLLPALVPLGEFPSFSNFCSNQLASCSNSYIINAK